jgi:hypothetical protein
MIRSRVTFAAVLLVVLAAAGGARGREDSAVVALADESRFAPIAAGVPTIVDVPFRDDCVAAMRARGTPDAPAAAAPTSATAGTGDRNCSALLVVSGLTAGRRYEARVSFAGSPPLRYEVEVVRLVRRSAASALAGGNRASGQSRVLLDTEREQFVVGPSSAFDGTPALRDFRHTVAAVGGAVRVAIVREHSRSRSAGGGDAEAGAAEASFQARSPTANDDEYAVAADGAANDAVAVCVRVFPFGVATVVDDEFLAEAVGSAAGGRGGVAPDKDAVADLVFRRTCLERARFVVTVDEMLLGALPASALPSVLLAVVLAGVALAAAVPAMPRLFS